MEIEFVGAAQTVTGSMHLVRTPHALLLLDCGLFQGRRQESAERNRHLPLPVKDIDAVILSHAHIDHSGALPLLVKQGYDGPIYSTHATRDLCAAMLMDAASIQESDARYLNKQIERGQLDSDRVEALYTEADAVAALERFVTLPYHRTFEVAPGVRVTFFDAGHVLGSAITALDVDEGAKARRLVFTGDLGRNHMPILRDPEVVPGAEILISESTYGDRLHDPISKMDDDLAETIKRTFARGGKVIIPAFALERAQEVVFALKALRRSGSLPPIPVFIDSPLTAKITEVFKMHPECFDEEARAMVRAQDPPFEFDGGIVDRRRVVVRWGARCRGARRRRGRPRRAPRRTSWGRGSLRRRCCTPWRAWPTRARRERSMGAASGGRAYARAAAGDMSRGTGAAALTEVPEGGSYRETDA